jgi:hypothetical protein
MFVFALKRISYKNRLLLAVVAACLLVVFSSFRTNLRAASLLAAREEPKIVNIVNFIRLLEPRDPKITEDVLYQTVVKQVELMNKYKLRGSFLLQYDALMDPRYQKLLRSLPRNSFEIGAWWEIPQPLVEKAGLKWRGRYPWDWRANVGFSTGYTPQDRERLADVYMSDFKRVFGYYPKSVASWFIDAHTLNYMYEKYHIVASANCKDQIGTDGYTLWGGYYNQAYYPSKLNAYMPAQNAQNQIPVPIFRMLGSDPIRQYNNGLGNRRQGVVTLEPVYPDAGGSENWINWYFKEFVKGEAMEFAYTQAGQENSFTWDAMEKGLSLQFPLIAQLRDEKKVKVETLAESGAWFRKKYKVTPATSVTINADIDGSDRKTVWFDSRFFRANLLWENGSLRFRDIHLFNEKFASVYEKQKATSNECVFYTLPMVDGNVWSSKEAEAGLSFRGIVDGKEILLEGKNPKITSERPGKLDIYWPLKSVAGTLEIHMDEKKISIKIAGNNSLKWYLDLTGADSSRLPFTSVATSRIDAKFQGMNYFITAVSGSFSRPNANLPLRIKPKAGSLVLNLSGLL